MQFTQPVSHNFLSSCLSLKHRVSSSDDDHVFGLFEETESSKGNPHKDNENMQIQNQHTVAIG